MYTLKNAKEKCPSNLLKKIYDKDDNVLFGFGYIKGKVIYNYVPAELMETGRPFIVSVSLVCDGIGNVDLSSDTVFMNYSELPEMFPDNKFAA